MQKVDASRSCCVGVFAFDWSAATGGTSRTPIPRGRCRARSRRWCSSRRAGCGRRRGSPATSSRARLARVPDRGRAGEQAAGHREGTGAASGSMAGGSLLERAPPAVDLGVLLDLNQLAAARVRSSSSCGGVPDDAPGAVLAAVQRQPPALVVCDRDFVGRGLGDVAIGAPTAASNSAMHARRTAGRRDRRASSAAAASPSAGERARALGLGVVARGSGVRPAGGSCTTEAMAERARWSMIGKKRAAVPRLERRAAAARAPRIVRGSGSWHASSAGRNCSHEKNSCTPVATRDILGPAGSSRFTR